MVTYDLMYFFMILLYIFYLYYRNPSRMVTFKINLLASLRKSPYSANYPHQASSCPQYVQADFNKKSYSGPKTTAGRKVPIKVLNHPKIKILENQSCTTAGIQSLEIWKKVLGSFDNVFHVYLMNGLQKYQKKKNFHGGFLR